MPCFLQRRFGLVMAMSVALALLASPVPAEGQLDIVAKFEDADLGLDVVTYTNPDVCASLYGDTCFPEEKAQKLWPSGVSPTPD
jgi:hypothetical protein